MGSQHLEHQAEVRRPRPRIAARSAGHRVRAGVDLGTRRTFADLGQTLAELFDVGRLPPGVSFRKTLVAEPDP